MVGTVLLAAVWIQVGYGPGVTAAQQRSNTSDRRPMVLDRAPARMIADPNPVFRAVVLDAEHGEVFMANDKESAGTSVLVYPTQFPPTNRILEPRRRIAGPKTDLGMVCGLALSIEHGELYSVSGETGTLNVYPLDSRSEEHTSELQSHHDLVCRLLLEKKKHSSTELLRESRKLASAFSAADRSGDC